MISHSAYRANPELSALPRHILAWWILLLSLTGMSASDRPNIIFIISDDQAWNDYHFMGHPHIQTPNLDNLARNSRIFRNGYVTTSLCSPSLASIITGLYPCQHKITGNEPPAPLDAAGHPPFSHPDFLKGREQMDDFIRNARTLPKLLRQHGYRSFQSGKWWHGSYADAGFDEGMTHGDPHRGGRHGDEGLKIGRPSMDPIFEFIQKDKSKPFFVWYAPFLPHTPHNPPDRLFQKYRSLAPTDSIARYWAMCEWFDESCGQLMKFLEQNQLSDNTLICYITDNGWINLPDSSRFAPKSKRSPYDGGIRTPIMLHWPGHIPPQDMPQLALSIDLVPTLCSLLQIPEDPRYQGLDLLDDSQLNQRSSIQGAIYLHDAHNIHQPIENLTHWWIRQKNLKLIIPNPLLAPDETIQAFDISKDPFESHNILNELDPNTLSSLVATSISWWGRCHSLN